jgi:hypothetical protein
MAIDIVARVGGRETNRSLPQTQPLTPVLRPRSIPGVLRNLPTVGNVGSTNVGITLGALCSNSQRPCWLELTRVGPVKLTDDAHIATLVHMKRAQRDCWRGRSGYQLGYQVTEARLRGARAICTNRLLPSDWLAKSNTK